MSDIVFEKKEKSGANSTGHYQFGSNCCIGCKANRSINAGGMWCDGCKNYQNNKSNYEYKN